MADPKSGNETQRPDPVTRNTLIAQVLDSRPEAGKVLREAFGLPCEECVVAESETIEEGARYYGHDAEQIVAKLNACPLAPIEKVEKETPGTEAPGAKGST